MIKQVEAYLNKSFSNHYDGVFNPRECHRLEAGFSIMGQKSYF
jgi:hypothetical protein